LSRIDLDWEERHGFSWGKEAGIRESQIRKEIRETERIIAQWRERTPKRRAQHAAAAKRWKAKHPDEQAAHERRYDHSPKGHARRKRNGARKAAKRAAKRLAARGEERMCIGCGTVWCPIPSRAGRSGRGKYCGPGRCTMHMVRADRKQLKGWATRRASRS